MFSSVDTAGGAVPIPVERKEKDQGGGYESSIRFTHLGGLKMIRLQITDRSVNRCDQQDGRMSFHICVVGYVLEIPASLLLRVPT